MKKIILIGLMWMIILGVFVTAVSTPAPTGLIAWWQGEDGTDIIGLNNGVLKGDANNIQGYVNKAFSFDGDGDYVEIPDKDQFTVPAITVEAWIKPVYNDEESYTIISKQGITNENKNWIFFADGKKLYFGAYINTDLNPQLIYELVSSTDEASTQLILNKWNHVAGTFDGSTVALYLNNKQISKKTLEQKYVSGKLASSSQPILIGAKEAKGSVRTQFWKGLIDEVSIYNRALSPNEIKKIYFAKSFGKQIPSCSDGKKEGNEGCDDKNVQPGDGCDDKCQIEQGYICKEDQTGLSTCSKYVCGDSKKEGNEGCDDGNTASSDGCTGNTCQIEANFYCQETEGLSTCTKQICVPYKYSCQDPQTYQQCDGTGLNYKSSGSCPPNTACENEGECKAPQPEDQQCNPLSKDITALNENDKALVTKIIEALQKDDSLLKLDFIITSLKDWIKLVLQG